MKIRDGVGFGDNFYYQMTGYKAVQGIERDRKGEESENHKY